MSAHQLLVVLTDLSIAAMIVCIVVISFHAESYLQKLASLVAITLTVASIGFLIRIEATTVEEVIVAQKLIYMSVIHGVYAMTLFVFVYCNYKLPDIIVNGFIVVNSAVSVAAMTMNYHKLFYTSFEVVKEGNHISGLADNYGLFQIIAITTFVIYMVAAVGAIIAFAIQNVQKRGWYVWRLAAVVAFPCLAYSVPKLFGWSTDLQPIAFGIFMVLLTLMIYYNRLYDTKNDALAAEKLHSEVVDKQNKLLRNETVELNLISHVDELTGINNRRKYEEVITAIQEEGNLENILVGVIDINGLKIANDTLGHLAGDELIKATASILDDVLGAEGQVFRIGGDEFVAIIRNYRFTVDKYIGFLKERTEEWHGKEIDTVSFSYGFAESKDYPDKTLLQLVMEADKKMYECKEAYHKAHK